MDLNYAYEDYPAIMQRRAGTQRLDAASTKDKPAEAPEGETVTIPTEELKAAYSALQAARDATGEAIEKIRMILGV